MNRHSEEPIPAHGAILVTDVGNFNRDDRTSADMAKIRSNLRSFMDAALNECFGPALSRKVGFIDPGDGVGLVFSAETRKPLLFTKLLPAFEHRVKEHNRRAAEVAQLQLRAVLHCGEYFIDHPHSATHRGYSGREINLAFRLLDSPMLREALKKEGATHPVALLLSNDFYTKIISQQTPELKTDFTGRSIKTKDSTLIGWLWIRPTIKVVKPPTRIKNPSKPRRSTQISKTEKAIKLLEALKQLVSLL